MPNPTGINQYTGGGAPGVNAHPDHGHGEVKPSTAEKFAAQSHLETKLANERRFGLTADVKRANYITMHGHPPKK